MEGPNVLILPSFYPMKFDYPRGNFFQEQALMINKFGGNVAVTFNENRSLTSFSIERFKYAHFQSVTSDENGLLVSRRLSWNIVPTSSKLGRTIWVESSVNLIKRFIKQHGAPKVMHVHCAMYAGLVALKIKRLFNIPYIITEHSTLIETSLEHDDIHVYKEIYDQADKVIVVSNPFRQLLANKIGLNISDIHVIPNFIDFQYFNFQERRQLSQETFHIVTVCYHEDKKRLDRLLNAFHSLNKRYEKIRLSIGGQGPNTQSLVEQARTLGISEKVNFMGFLDKSQVRDLLRSAALFVLPSDVETFGVVLLEAIAMGVPVIGTRSGGPEDIIVDEVGFLVDRDQESIEEAIVSIYENILNYNPVKIRSYGIDNFGPEQIVNRYLEIYNTFS